MNIFASKSEVLRRRHELEFSLVDFQRLSFEYLWDGQGEHFENMRHRLLHRIEAVDLDEEFSYVFNYGIHLTRMKDQLDVKTSGDANETEASYRTRISRCKEIVNLFLQYDVDPSKPRDCWNGRSAFERGHRNKFYDDVVAMFAANKSHKRGAHLDEVLPQLIALEGAVAPKRARL